MERDSVRVWLILSVHDQSRREQKTPSAPVLFTEIDLKELKKDNALPLLIGC